LQEGQARNSFQTKQINPNKQINTNTFSPIQTTSDPQQPTGVLIGIAYGATCGGIATIIGTAPNSVLVSQIQLRFGQTITFGQWVSFAFPVALSLLFVAWPILCFFYVPRGKAARHLNLSQESFTKSRKAQGPVTRDQWVVAIVQLIMVVLWVTRPFLITPLTSFCVLPDAPTILQVQFRFMIDFEIVLFVLFCVCVCLLFCFGALVQWLGCLSLGQAPRGVCTTSPAQRARQPEVVVV
jgi:di/tricarboxylate transporter